MLVVRFLLVLAILFVNVGSVEAQVKGTQKPIENILNLAFQEREHWSGAKFTEHHSLFDRMFISVGYGVSSEFSSPNNKVSALNLSVGTWLAPVHGMEVTTNFNDLGITYIFNLTSFASMLEEPKRFMLQLKGGVVIDSQLGMYTAMRAQYRIFQSAEMFIEPSVSYFDDTRTSILGGVTFRLSSTRDMITDLWSSKIDIRRKMSVVLKSNLIYLLTPNIEMELQLNRFSLCGNFARGWWLKSDNRGCWQVQTYGVEGRYWLERRSRELTGWFIGVFATRGYYDIQLKSTQGVQGDLLLFTGVTAGYSKPISKWFNLEISTGIGYMLQESQRYTVVRGERLVATDAPIHTQGVLPAKAKVSLVWLISRGGGR